MDQHLIDTITARLADGEFRTRLRRSMKRHRELLEQLAGS
jgi:hypothetical protein